jgi:hypothetical protein
MNRQEFFKWLGLGITVVVAPKIAESMPEDAVTTNCTTLLPSKTVFPSYYVITCKVIRKYSGISYLIESSEPLRVGDDIMLPPTVLTSERESSFMVIGQYANYYTIAPYNIIDKVSVFNKEFDCFVMGGTLIKPEITL